VRRQEREEGGVSGEQGEGERERGKRGERERERGRERKVCQEDRREQPTSQASQARRPNEQATSSELRLRGRNERVVLLLLHTAVRARLL
jgi:hypothetical protein